MKSGFNRSIALLLFLCAGWTFAQSCVDEITKKMERTEDPFFVVLITSRNNESIVEWNLSSVFAQDYPCDKFHVVYVDDASTDATSQKVREVVDRADMGDHFCLITNQDRKYKMHNLYTVIKELPDSCVVVELDGDDAFASEHVLLDLLEAYKSGKVWITYSERMRTIGGMSFRSCFWDDDSDFRNLSGSLYCLRTFKAGLFKHLHLDDYTIDGEFIRVASDFAIFYPMMELARNNSAQVPGLSVVCNNQGPDHDGKHSPSQLEIVYRYVKSRARYAPLESL